MSLTSRGASRAMRSSAFVALLGASMTSAFAQTAPAAPAAPAPPITVNAQLELNYTANFNKPFNGSNLYLFNTKEGQFAVNLAEIKVSRATTPDARTGFTVRLIEGEVRKAFTNVYSLGNFNPGEYGGLPNVLEAYGTFLVPFHGKDVKVDVGQFVTHVGYETIDIGTNNFFSRNFLFQFPSPFYNAGVRAALPLSAKTTVSGFLLNRYNGVNDTGNRDIAPGIQIAQTLSSKSSIILNGLTSRDNIAYDGSQQPGTDVSAKQNGKQVSVIDLIYTNQFSPSLKLVAEGLYRTQKATVLNANQTFGDKTLNVTGGAIYLIAPFKNGNTFALRGETLSQNLTLGQVDFFGFGGDKSNKKTNLSSVTASYELHSGLFPGLRTLVEYRYDTSNQKVFAGSKSGVFKSNQSTLTLGQVYAF